MSTETYTEKGMRLFQELQNAWQRGDGPTKLKPRYEAIRAHLKDGEEALFAEYGPRPAPPAPEGWAEAVAGAQRTIAALHGHETWYVMNAAADGYCMSFASPEYLNPQRACEKWLGEQNPEWIARNGYHAVQSFGHTVVERMAIEAAQAVLSMDALMKGKT